MWNKKEPTNKETNNKVDEKTYIEWSGLKQNDINSQA